MNRLMRKVSALMLTAAIAMGTVAPSFAANAKSPVTPVQPTQPTTPVQPTADPVGTAVSGNDETTSTTITAVTIGDTTVAVTQATSKDTIEIPATITASNGKTYTVNVIKTGTITQKYLKATLILNNTTTVEAQIAKSKRARKTKKVVIKAAAGQKLTASQFDKKAFKKFKGKIVVKKSAMTKKQFRKLKKKLRKGGFKGKIVYKK